MTEPITSKYSNLYWVKDLCLPLVPIVLICIFGYSALIKTGMVFTLEDDLEIVGILLIFPLAYGIRLYFSPPKRITITIEGIDIYQFILKRHVFIKYDEIDKMRTLRASGVDNIFSQLNSSQIFEIELNDGVTYRFTEDEYENYNALKAAIYDHKLRGL